MEGQLNLSTQKTLQNIVLYFLLFLAGDFINSLVWDLFFSVGEPRKICVKRNKRHPFSQESEQEINLIERKYYNGTDAEGNAESIRGQSEVQQHHRDHGRDERDVPGRIAAGDGKRAGYGAGVRKKSAHVGNGCRKQAAELSQRALEKDGKNAIGGGGSKDSPGPERGI